MRILIAGDYCPQERVVECLNNLEFETVFGEIRPIVEQIDYSIVNLECPLSYGCEEPMGKCGPNLCCQETGIEAIKWIGFDCVTLANNHFCDYGIAGIKNTLDACERFGLDTVGGGLNLEEASRTLYKHIGGSSLAIINCCEHEFSIATDASPGSNPLDPVSQYYKIKEAKSNADYVFVIVHGGNEYYQLPSPRMRDTYHFFVDAGADAVINHHQHCFSGHEVYKGKPILYGLGNFCFDNNHWRNSNWNRGYLAIIDTDCLDHFELQPYSQCDAEPRIITKIDNNCCFWGEINRLNAIICNDDELKHSYNSFIRGFQKLILFGFEPYHSSRLSQSLYLRGFLPSFLSKKKIDWLLNYIGCESHLPKVLTALSLLKESKNETAHQ